MADFSGLAFSPTDILLPDGVDMTDWSCVACDQFTSEPEYWENASDLVGAAPSALRLILPEAQLESPDVDARIEQINAHMDEYIAEGIFTEYSDSLIFVERVQSDGHIRRGIVGQIDLAQYDFTPGSNAAIRATEGTVLSRIPPRAAVRRNAAIELPHVMLLIDDAQKSVIEPLRTMTAQDEPIYDFDLMLGGGHIRGYLLTEQEKEHVAAALHSLMEKNPDLLCVVGDGNHSLASAKKCYEDKLAAGEPADIPARYALAELVNLYDDALVFEPIHRVLCDVDPGHVRDSLFAAYPGAHEGDGNGQTIRYYYAGHEGQITIPDPPAQLAVDSLQRFLDKYIQTSGGTIDYIHDDDTAIKLGRRDGAIAFLLPAMGKYELFPTVIKDGVLPRKTFSMGHAKDKRYYLEARKIK